MSWMRLLVVCVGSKPENHYASTWIKAHASKQHVSVGLHTKLDGDLNDSADKLAKTNLIAPPSEMAQKY